MSEEATIRRILHGDERISMEWDVGFRDRGHGHGDFGIIVKETGEIVIGCLSREIAVHIVSVHNGSVVKAERADS